MNCVCCRMMCRPSPMNRWAGGWAHSNRGGGGCGGRSGRRPRPRPAGMPRRGLPRRTPRRPRGTQCWAGAGSPTPLHATLSLPPSLPRFLPAGVCHHRGEPGEAAGRGVFLHLRAPHRRRVPGPGRRAEAGGWRGWWAGAARCSFLAAAPGGVPPCAPPPAPGPCLPTLATSQHTCNTPPPHPTLPATPHPTRQVYKAVLRETGESVAVKVQRPGRGAAHLPRHLHLPHPGHDCQRLVRAQRAPGWHCAALRRAAQARLPCANRAAAAAPPGRPGRLTRSPLCCALHRSLRRLGCNGELIVDEFG